MTSLIAKYISKKVLGESVKNNFGTEDPYFESVPATRLDGRPSSKTKKRRKALPPGLSEHDGKVLTKVKRRAYRLDMSLFNCCGIRFGWGSVIGIIPGIGDVIDAFMALMVMRTCQQVEGGLPSSVKSKMMFNIMLDFVVGLVPFIGDLADAVFRANTRNAVELEKYLREKGAKNLKAQGQSAATVVDPSDPDEYDRIMRAENGPPPAYDPSRPDDGRNGTYQTQAPMQPSRATQSSQPSVQKDTSSSSGGLFGFGKKQKQSDVEHAMSSRQNDPLPALPQENVRQEKSTLQKNRR